MADNNQLKIIKQGAEVWNRWRKKNPTIQVNLKKANLINANLSNVNLSRANLIEADLGNAELLRANFYKANLRKAILTNANLTGANFYKANLTAADLTGANLEHAGLASVHLGEATLKDCKVYGLSAWDLYGTPEKQLNLVITKKGQPEITVDDLQVAQFVYLLLDRENLRNVLETITSRAVLILGRFTTKRKRILNTIADESRKHNLLPIIFDFKRAASRNFTETIKILVGMSLFVIADITNPKSVPMELQAIIPDYKIPFITIHQAGEKRFSMFDDLMQNDWVLQPITYSSIETIRQVFKDLILEKAIEKHKELQLLKTKQIQSLSADEYLRKKTT